MASYAGRRRTNLFFLGLSIGAALLGIMALLFILGALLWNGVAGLSLAVFTQMTPPPGSAGGLLNAIYGSLVMTTIGLLIGAPIGLMAGTYMAEYGRYSKLTLVIRFINDILLSAPSIIVGLFVYEVMVAPLGHFSGIAGAVALSILVIPIVARTTEDMLLLVPNPLREAAAALGLPRAYVITRVAYRAARAGLITAMLLAFARISGETAPLLFTALNNQFWNSDLRQPTSSLPAVIFQFALSPYKEWQQLAWTGALRVLDRYLDPEPERDAQPRMPYPARQHDPHDQRQVTEVVPSFDADLARHAALRPFGPFAIPVIKVDKHEQP